MHHQRTYKRIEVTKIRTNLFASWQLQDRRIDCLMRYAIRHVPRAFKYLGQHYTSSIMAGHMFVYDRCEKLMGVRVISQAS